MDKIKISQAIIVEGKYDKIKLSSFIDGVIICTNGFRIYSDRKTVELIRMYARTSGIVILTDSDSAGFQIRGHIKSIVPDGKIINLYIPDIFGKEKRKAEPSKEGKLGVEGISTDILRTTFEKAGLFDDKPVNRQPVTKMDFFDAGLSGGQESVMLRKKLCEKLDFPVQMTAKALLEAVNRMLDRDEFLTLMEEILRSVDND